MVWYVVVRCGVLFCFVLLCGVVWCCDVLGYAMSSCVVPVSVLCTNRPGTQASF